LQENEFSGYNYFKIIEQYSEYFGEDNMIVRVYEKQQLVNEDIVDDFMSIFPTIDTSEFSRNFMVIDITPSAESTEILRMMNQEKVKVFKVHAFLAACDEFFKSNEKKNLSIR